jgi:hypothetical protein
VADAANGYPAHLQFYAHEAWQVAAGPSRITFSEVARALPQATRAIRRRSLEPRWERMSGRQRELAAALAALGGRAAIAAISAALGKNAKQWSRNRDALISAGDVYAPRRGELELTVPAFADFILERYEQDSQGDSRFATLDQMRARL